MATSTSSRPSPSRWSAPSTCKCGLAAAPPSSPRASRSGAPPALHPQPSPQGRCSPTSPSTGALLATLFASRGITRCRLEVLCSSLHQVLGSGDAADRGTPTADRSLVTHCVHPARSTQRPPSPSQAGPGGLASATTCAQGATLFLVLQRTVCFGWRLRLRLSAVGMGAFVLRLGIGRPRGVAGAVGEWLLAIVQKVRGWALLVL